MDEREYLIERLKNCINKRENTNLTNEQIDHYIGSDMSNDKLRIWVDETEDLSDPVTAADVTSLWEDYEHEMAECKANN